MLIVAWQVRRSACRTGGLRLADSRAPQAEEARRLVMRLSGRQVEYGRGYTREGLLAGTWVLLALAECYDKLARPAAAADARKRAAAAPSK